MEEVERIARLLCRDKGIDPDGRGYAMTKQTEQRLGKEYPLWRYQAMSVELVLREHQS
jgi:hypothetical protein